MIGVTRRRDFMPIDIGLTEEQRAQSVQALKKLLETPVLLFAD